MKSIKKLLGLFLAVLIAFSSTFTAYAVDNFKEFQFELSVNGEKTKQAMPGEVITVVFYLNRTDSSEEYDMYAAMNGAEELFSKYGGHKMAGGLSLKSGVTPEIMRQKLNDICTLTDEDLIKKIRFDMQLPFAHADMDLVTDIRRLEPFGAGNPRPLFAAKGVRLRNINVCGNSRNVVKCIAADEYGTSCNAIFFGDADEFCQYSSGRESLKILYYPDINEYRGERTLQIHIQSYC